MVMRRIAVLSGVAAIAVAVLTYATAPVAKAQVFSKQVDQDTFPGRWPVTADAGILACDTTRAYAVTFTPSGSETTYAVNGPALDWGKKVGWPDAEEIWNGSNWGDFIDTGLEMCG